MSANIIELLNEQQPLLTTPGNYISIFDPTNSNFWCSESGSEMTCNRQWVQVWELFNIVKDSFSGKTMIKSRETLKYLTVMPDNTIRCKENRSVMETHFEIDEEQGYFKAYNHKFLAVNERKLLMAKSEIPVAFEIFDVKTVALTDPDTTDYARPSNGRILMDSPIPYTFYLLCNRANGNTYLETKEFDFIIPNNTIQPITYDRTPIDVKNYRLKVTCVDPVNSIYTILSEATNCYFTRDSSGTHGAAIYANTPKAEGLLQNFRIVSTE